MASEMNSWEIQLKLCKGISYAAVAGHADKIGRRKLAAMLVDHEPRSSKQVFFSLHVISSSWILLFLGIKTYKLREDLRVSCSIRVVFLFFHQYISRFFIKQKKKRTYSSRHND